MDAPVLFVEIAHLLPSSVQCALRTVAEGQSPI
jgi:hypothetical protein